jgi:hypothetical protein
MKTQPNAAQIKVLKQTMNDAAADLEYTFEFLVAELSSACRELAVQVAAERGLWLAVSDAAYREFDLDLPEYAKATGRVKSMVDRAATRLSLRLAAA